MSVRKRNRQIVKPETSEAKSKSLKITGTVLFADNECVDIYLFKDHKDFPQYEISVQIFEQLWRLESAYFLNQNDRFEWHSIPLRSAAINAMVIIYSKISIV